MWHTCGDMRVVMLSWGPGICTFCLGVVSCECWYLDMHDSFPTVSPLLLYAQTPTPLVLMDAAKWRGLPHQWRGM